MFSFNRRNFMDGDASPFFFTTVLKRRGWTWTHCAHLQSWSYCNAPLLLLLSSRRAPLPLSMRGRRALIDDLSLENSDSEEPPASPTPPSGLPRTPTPSSEHNLDPGPPPYGVNNTEWCTQRLKQNVLTCTHANTSASHSLDYSGVKEWHTHSTSQINNKVNKVT